MKQNKQRGDDYSNGLYVGTTTAGVEWIARENRTGSLAANFAKLCARFDDRDVVRFSKIRSEQVILAAEMELESGSESGRLDPATITIGATFIEAPRSFFQDLAEVITELADDWQHGDRSIAQECFSADLADGFVEAAGKRTAKSLRRWARRFEAV